MLAPVPAILGGVLTFRYFFFFALWFSSRRFSTSLTRRQNGTFNARAILSAAFSVGLIFNRSISEIIFGAKSARSASSSCVMYRALRCSRTTCPKNVAKSPDSILPRCLPKQDALQEGYYQFAASRNPGKPVRSCTMNWGKASAVNCLALREQEIAGALHDFVTQFRLRSETNNKQSDHGWTQLTRKPSRKYRKSGI